MNMAVIRDRAVISGNASACGHSQICDNSYVHDKSIILSSAIISGKSTIAGNSIIHADVVQNAFIGDHGVIEKDTDYFVVNKPLNSTLWDSLTFYNGFNYKGGLNNKIYIASYPSRTPLESETFLAIVRFHYGRFSDQYKQAKRLVKYAKQRLR